MQVIWKKTGVLSTLPNPHSGGPPLAGCAWLLIQYICGYPPYNSLLFHLQPEAWGCAMPWWQEPTYHGTQSTFATKTKVSKCQPCSWWLFLTYNVQGVLVCCLISQGQTVNAQYYKSILQLCPELTDNAGKKHPEPTENATSLCNKR